MKKPGTCNEVVRMPDGRRIAIFEPCHHEQVLLGSFGPEADEHLTVALICPVCTDAPRRRL